MNFVLPGKIGPVVIVMTQIGQSQRLSSGRILLQNIDVMSTSLVVMGGDSRFRGRGFVSWSRIPITY